MYIKVLFLLFLPHLSQSHIGLQWDGKCLVISETSNWKLRWEYFSKLETHGSYVDYGNYLEIGSNLNSFYSICLHKYIL